MSDMINHPPHYGGDKENNPYETIKVIEAWELGFCLGNTVKYISRAGKKGDALEDLRKAAWYLNREIWQREREDFPDKSNQVGCGCEGSPLQNPPAIGKVLS